VSKEKRRVSTYRVSGFAKATSDTPACRLIRASRRSVTAFILEKPCNWRRFAYRRLRLRFVPDDAMVGKLARSAFRRLKLGNLKCDLQSRREALNWAAFGKTKRLIPAGFAKEVYKVSYG
jgi:hypothetical protein